MPTDFAFRIERIVELAPYDSCALRHEAASEGQRFVERLYHEFRAGENRFDGPGEVLLGAFDRLAGEPKNLVGICGLNVDPFVEDLAVGRVRRMYVRPRYRRFGVGRALVGAVIAAAKPHYRLLVLRTDNPAADAFYRSLGFHSATEYPGSTHALELRGGLGHLG